MALLFPPNPTPGQVYLLWTWDGQKWVCTGGGGGGGAGGDIIGNGVVGMASKTVIFNNSGTYTPSAGITSAMVECFGGGGGGGTVPAGWIAGGGGGGSGGYSRVVLLPAQIGSSQPVTIGSGGAPDAAGNQTTFGSLCVANGGSPGLTTLAGAMEGGAGATRWAGAGVAGAFAVAGCDGTHAFVANYGGSPTPGTPMPVAGIGGAIFGGGVGGEQDAGPGFGYPGVAGGPNTGAGGSGAVSNVAASAYAGGVGGSGVCIITEFSA